MVIYVEPSELWDYFHENQRLIETNLVVIAESPDDGIEIVLGKNKINFPEVQVYFASTLIDSQSIYSRADAIIKVREVYDAYITEPIENSDSDEEENVLHEIEVREDELYDALWSFIDVVLGNNNTMTDNEFDEVLDNVLADISSLGFNVYRPSMLKDENGELVFEEFPYAEAEESQPE